MVKSATFPDPAADHPGEAAMLAAVLADLTDDLPKLVYADWLEEHDDPRGPFLREFTTAARNGGKLPKPKKLSKAWLDLIGIRAVMAVRKHKLPVTPDELLRDALPALAIINRSVNEKSLPVGTSKFGGDPDVPPGFEWPIHDGKPLSFLAQFNLPSLSSSAVGRELPASGLLSVFYSTRGDVIDVKDAGGWRVYHFPDSDAVKRQPTPDDTERLPACRLAFTESLVPPPSFDFDEDEHTDAYQEHVRAGLGHYLFGLPDWLQGGPGWYDEVRKGRPKYRHLLTLGSDRKAGWMWGDSGLLYFGISADDLKAGRFDRTLFEMQCC